MERCEQRFKARRHLGLFRQQEIKRSQLLCRLYPWRQDDRQSEHFCREKFKRCHRICGTHANAIGIIGSNWLNDKRDSTNTTWNKSITVMSVSKLDKATPMNSWKPYQAWLLNGRYPFVRTIYALLNDPKRGLPWGFAHFIESPRGQLIIFKSGLLPTRGEIAIRDVNVNNKPR